MDAPRSALITGTSSGLGLRMAVTLASRGWQVYASMRDLARRSDLDVATEEARLNEDLVKVVQLDVTDPASIRSALDVITAGTGGRLDALVNNAGVNIEACLEDIDITQARRLFDTLTLGPMELTQAALPMLRKAADPRVIFISSFAAVTGGPQTTMYSAAKAAIERFAEALAWEVAADGIRISVIRPGFHRSNIFIGNSGRVRPSGSRYWPVYNRMDAWEQIATRHARDPANVALTLAQALQSDHPKFRYNVGWDARLVVCANPVLPQRLRERFARAIFQPTPKGRRWAPAKSTAIRSIQRWLSADFFLRPLQCSYPSVFGGSVWGGQQR